MVGFFIKIGDPDDVFTPYLWGAKGLRTYIETYSNNGDYGSGLKLLLIQVYVEGRFEVYGPEQVQVGNYSKVREETNVAFTVRREDFQDKNDSERKAFLSMMVLQAVEEVRRKHSKKMNCFDFQALKESLVTATEHYLLGTPLQGVRRA